MKNRHINKCKSTFDLVNLKTNLVNHVHEFVCFLIRSVFKFCNAKFLLECDWFIIQIIYHIWRDLARVWVRIKINRGWIIKLQCDQQRIDISWGSNLYHRSKVKLPLYIPSHECHEKWINGFKMNIASFYITWCKQASRGGEPQPLFHHLKSLDLLISCLSARKN